MISIQERTFEFACRVVKFHEYLLRQRGTARSLAKQLLTCGTSIAANLEEASGGQSKADFILKCRIALKESREALFWLRLYDRTELVPSPRVRPLIEEANEIVSILTVIVKKASASSARGHEEIPSS